MKYLRVFNNDAEYKQFKGGGDYITPNVCLNRETNGIKCEAYIPPPPPVQTSNEIWYTSTDGNIVTPYYEDIFDANIVSNIYENGKGIITFDGPVTSIGNNAFYNCTSLTSVTIPESVTSIGMNAFSNCTSLTSVIIPDSVTMIVATTFQYCSSLTSITIPDSVTIIGDRAFYGCTSLTSVYCTPIVPPRGGYEMFTNIATGCKIYVPTASVDTYKSAYKWSSYANYIVGYDF